MIPALDGYQYGAMFEDGSVARRWNGRTQRRKVEEYIHEQCPHCLLVRRRPGGEWEEVWPRDNLPHAPKHAAPYELDVQFDWPNVGATGQDP